MKYIKIAILIIVVIIIMIVSIIFFINGPIQKDKNEVTKLENVENENNTIINNDITDFEMLKLYFEDYKYKALHSPEEAFRLIDNEYREKKFGNDIEQYKTYISNNLARFQDANIVKHGITKNGQFRTYIAIDSFNNYYKITETGINEYTIILDNYTLEDEEITNKYNKASETDKVTSNIDKMMKLINEKSYEQIYNYLNDDFKNNYFPTFEAFKNYMDKTFFYNNIVGNLIIEPAGQNYVVKVPYKEGIDTAAEEREITIIMQLKEGTDFEIAFGMQ